MNTYVINVERKTVNQYTVQANSLKEAKKEAMRIHHAGSDIGKTKVQTICQAFYPFSEKV